MGELTGVLSPGVKPARHEADHQPLHLVPRLGMRGAIP
jgi:hypothetical protein